MVSDQLGVDDHLLGVVLLHDALKSKEKFEGWVQNADLCCGSENALQSLFLDSEFH